MNVGDIKIAIKVKQVFRIYIPNFFFAQLVKTTVSEKTSFHTLSMATSKRLKVIHF